MDAYLTCEYCGHFSAPVSKDGSEWCRNCGYERSNIVIGEEFPHVPTDAAKHAVSPIFASSPRCRLPGLSHPSSAHQLSSHTANIVRRDLDVVAQQCNIPESIVRQAYKLFASIHAVRETRAQMQKALLANCMYRCCLLNNIQRSCRDVKHAFGISAKKFNVAEKILQQHAPNLGKSPVSDHASPVRPTKIGCDHAEDATDYGISPNVYKHAIFLPDNAGRIPFQTIRVLRKLYSTTHAVHGKSPDKLSACALFLMCGASQISLCGHCTAADIKCAACVKYACDNFNVGKITLQNHYKLLKPLMF
jgi:transcription initiation factor TFIIIB Brf1 subunit/transcription initiation factor TFIIB